MASVFISYRRTDSLAITKRIAHHLQHLLGKHNVFLDIDSISSGEMFPQRLQIALRRADAILVVIGHDWATAADATGLLRLTNPADFVRREVVSALASGKPVIPFLVDGASLIPADVPTELLPLLHLPSLAATTQMMDKLGAPLVLRQVQSQAIQAELRRLPRIPYPFLAVTALLATLGGVGMLSEAYRPTLRNLDTFFNDLYGLPLFIGMLVAFIRIQQDRLFGWFFVVCAVIGVPFVVGESDQALKPYSFVWGVAVILTIGILSVSGQRLGRKFTLWRIARASRKG